MMHMTLLTVMSFLFLCGEMLPSVLRPLVGPMRSPTSPNGLELRASKEHANVPFLVPHNRGLGDLVYIRV